MPKSPRYSILASMLYLRARIGALHIILAAAILAMLGSCDIGGNKSTLETEVLFSLEYGGFEKELNLFDLSSTREVITRAVMQDGLFYVANGAARKILVLNSFGELLTLYYNEDTGLVPPFLTSVPSLQSTQKAFKYPFNTLGALTLDNEKRLYVVDTLPHDRISYDSEEGLQLNQVVLRFGSNGSFDNYLGQQGPGGTPFPYIKDIFCNKDGELIVTTVNNKGTTAYWFSTEGFLLYQTTISYDNIPQLKGEDEDKVLTTIDNIVPSPNDRILFIKIDRFNRTQDSASHLLTGIQYKESYLLPYNIEEQIYEDPIFIPPLENTKGENSPYNFLGISQSRTRGQLFFIAPDSSGASVQIIDEHKKRTIKRHIDIDNTNLVYSYFSLSPRGIISAILADDKAASFVWWRTDKLISD